MRALVTGVTGFAGSFLAEHLRDCGDNVLGISRGGVWRERWSARNWPDQLARDVELLAWDVAAEVPQHARARIAAFAPDAVFHLAALSVPSDCGEEEPTAEALEVNVAGTRRVLDLAASLAIRPRVLVVSSAHVYAPVDATAPRVSEDAPLGPKNAYGRTKLAAESIAIEFADCERWPVVIARAFGHTGPRQEPRLMVPEWTRQFARGDDPVQVVSLDSHVDLTDVRDVARAYRLLMARDAVGVYNVGSGVNRRSGDVFERLVALSGRRPRVEQSRPGRQQQPIADCTRLRRIAGWKPAISWERTLADTLAFWEAERNS